MDEDERRALAPGGVVAQIASGVHRARLRLGLNAMQGLAQRNGFDRRGHFGGPSPVRLLEPDGDFEALGFFDWLARSASLMSYSSRLRRTVAKRSSSRPYLRRMLGSRPVPISSRM